MGIKNNSLYLVISEEYGNGRSASEIAQSAISGGIDILQMREKQKSGTGFNDLGKELSLLCKKNSVTFIVNDDPYLAKEVDAGGVHLGQEDVLKYGIEKTRDIIGKDKIIGVSTHSLDQFTEANGSDVDYIAFGPIFHTETKDYSIGTLDVQKVLSITNKPVIFIGGINLDNVDSVLEKGAENIAVIRAITQAKDVEMAARALRDIMKQGGKHE